MKNKDKKLKSFEKALEVMDRLREECPWNRAQTNESLRPMTLEEVYELSDAVLKKEEDNLKKELGDVFLHIMFYSRIAEEEGRFDIADVMDKLCEKMIYRHPHVFSDTKAADAEEKEDDDNDDNDESWREYVEDDAVEQMDETDEIMLSELEHDERRKDDDLEDEDSFDDDETKYDYGEGDDIPDDDFDDEEDDDEEEDEEEDEEDDF